MDFLLEGDKTMVDPLADLCDLLLKAGTKNLILNLETELKQVKSLHILCSKIG